MYKRTIYWKNDEITLDEARNYQTESRILINKLNIDYNPRIPEKANEKNKVLESVRKLLNPRKDIIGFFEKGTFSYKGNVNKNIRIRRRTRTGKIQKMYRIYWEWIKGY